MSKQDIQNITQILGTLRIDTSYLRQDITNLFNELAGLKIGLNDINIKLDRDVIPYAATAAKTTSVLKNIEDILVNIRGSIQDIYTKINYSQVRPLQVQGPTPMDIDQKIESINKHQDDFLEKLQKRLESDNILEKLRQNYLSIEQTKLMIDTSTQKILDKVTLSDITSIIDNQNANFVAIIPKLSDIGNDVHTLLTKPDNQLEKFDYTKLDTIRQDLDYLKIILREPVDQSETHKNLKEILRQIQLLNIDDLNRQILKLLAETVGQTDFSYKLAEAIKLDIRDRLIRIENNFYKFVTQGKTSETFSGQVTRETSITTETYLIYTEGQAPDRKHFII